MTSQLQPRVSPNDFNESGKRRAAWRQQLVDVERGFTHGVRGDSRFFVQFFIATIVAAAAFVLRITLMQWTIVVLALTVVLAAEMFNQVAKAILLSISEQTARPAQKALRIGSAAVFVAAVGAILAVGLIFGQRLLNMLGG